MRRALTVVLLLSSLAACDKGPPKSAAPAAANAAPAATAKPTEVKGQTFGAGVKLADTTPIETILAEPKKFAGQTVRVQGMVTDVCPKRGCWFEMAGTKPGQKLRFKVTDGEMVFPPDAKGKTAVAEGVVAVKDLSLEESKEYAKYQAEEYKLPYDPANVTEPMSIVRIDGTGAVFVN
jgi:predicted small lipoprotein YifL